MLEEERKLAGTRAALEALGFSQEIEDIIKQEKNRHCKSFWTALKGHGKSAKNAVTIAVHAEQSYVQTRLLHNLAQAMACSFRAKEDLYEVNRLNRPPTVNTRCLHTGSISHKFLVAQNDTVFEALFAFFILSIHSRLWIGRPSILI
jgi:hypothetical protein